MSTPAVIRYDDVFKEEVRLSLIKMQRDYPADLEDAVKDRAEKVKIALGTNKEINNEETETSNTAGRTRNGEET